MTTNAPPLTPPSTGLVALFAGACGVAAANIYYAQPLVGFIAPELGVPAALAGLIMTLTQVGYGVGLLAIVPLADLVPNRRLIVTTFAGLVTALVAIALNQSVAGFFLLCFAIGCTATAAQILMPLISHLTPEHARGRVVGNVLGGLLAGIMLARPLSSFVAGHFGWRAVFAGSAVLMAIVTVVLARYLPERRPVATTTYLGSLRSLPRLFAASPTLRRRALYQGMMFLAFNIFWTGSPLVLVDLLGFTHDDLAWFALAGAAGAAAAPWAGRIADRGHSRRATGFALAAAAITLSVAAWAVTARNVPLLIVAAIVLDAAVQVCQVVSLRTIYLLAPEQRGRLNGLFMAAVFGGGALGSALASVVYEAYGWTALALCGVGAIAIALAAFTTERRAAPAMMPPES